MHEPATRVAFPTLLTWARLLIYANLYSQAEELIKGYISASTALKQDNTNEGSQEQQKPMWLSGKSGELELSEPEYTELIELLVFAIYLPQKGYKATCDKLKSIPLPRETKGHFDSKLIEVRNMAAADV